jgi:outer membrane receptor protein involved in Fe transport
LQSSRRLQSHGDLTLTDRKWHGVHKLQAGFNIDSAHLDRTADRHAVEIRQSDLRTIRTSSFSGEPQLSISETQAGAYLQDSWQFAPSLIFESSLRVDRNDFVRATLVEWALRLSVINATAHKNFSSVINNVDAPTFLTFAGGQHRAFTARLRLVGRK